MAHARPSNSHTIKPAFTLGGTSLLARHLKVNNWVYLEPFTQRWSGTCHVRRATPNPLFFSVRHAILDARTVFKF